MAAGLASIPGVSRRIRIALDWKLELLFRREYVQLGVHKFMGEAGR